MAGYCRRACADNSGVRSGGYVVVVKGRLAVSRLANVCVGVCPFVRCLPDVRYIAHRNSFACFCLYELNAAAAGGIAGFDLCGLPSPSFSTISAAAAIVIVVVGVATSERRYQKPYVCPRVVFHCVPYPRPCVVCSIRQSVNPSHSSSTTSSSLLLWLAYPFRPSRHCIVLIAAAKAV